MVNQLRYKTFFPRLGALIIDGILYFFCSWALDALVALLFAEGRAALWFDDGKYLLFLIYHVVAHAQYGMTVGKWVAQVRVTGPGEHTEGGIGFRRAATRELLPLASWLLGLDALDVIPGLFFLGLLAGLLSLADIIATIADPQNRSLHDRIAGTVVVNLRYPPVPQTFEFEEPEAAHSRP